MTATESWAAEVYGAAEVNWASGEAWAGEVNWASEGNWASEQERDDYVGDGYLGDRYGDRYLEDGDGYLGGGQRDDDRRDEDWDDDGRRERADGGRREWGDGGRREGGVGGRREGVDGGWREPGAGGGSESGGGRRKRADGGRRCDPDLANLDAADPEDDERVARAAWSRLAEPGDIPARELVAAEGAASALAMVRQGQGEPRWQARLPEVDAVHDLATLRRFGGRLLIPGDPEWPSGVDRLEFEAPFCLWVRGPLSLRSATERSAAIVGARAATPYGERVATELADGCANRGITVVSGAAYGIDGAAHRGALAAGGPTIAVLACGVERTYPRGHEDLIGRIVHEGAVVSEVPPGSLPTRWRFIERNRLIAALSRATVVVEAAHRSGALGTAARADKLSLPVAAVPGPVTSAVSYGCHRLLRNGAICVTSAAELAELCGPMGEFVAEELPIPSAVQDGLDPRDLRVFDALPLRKAIGLPSLVKSAGLEAESVQASLGRLELRGLTIREGSGWRRAPTPRG